MSRPAKPELRASITRSRTELALGNPFMPASEMDRITALAHGCSISTVRYYLRTNSPIDGRIRYTPEERRQLSTMTRAELLAYATRHNRNFNTLYSMVHRLKHTKVYDAWDIERHVHFCEERGYIDFSRAADLKAFLLPLDSFKEARKVVRGIQNLDLKAPNYLTHAASKKFYILDLAEQKFLLNNPRRFLREKAAYISHRWKSSEHHPRRNYFMLVDTAQADPEMAGICESTHPRLICAIMARKTLEAAGDPRTFDILQRAGAWAEPQLHFTKGEKVPRFSPDAIGSVFSQGNHHTVMLAIRG